MRISFAGQAMIENAVLSQLHLNFCHCLLSDLGAKGACWQRAVTNSDKVQFFLTRQNCQSGCACGRLGQVHLLGEPIGQTAKPGDRL
jgi:hypothetical protein